MKQYYHLFPFERVKCGSRIALYGAGEVGQWYLAQMRQSGYAEVVAISDQDWDKYPDMGVPLIEPQKLAGLEVEQVVVSIEDRAVALSAAQLLATRYGIPWERIVLGCESLGEQPVFLKRGAKSRQHPSLEQIMTEDFAQLQMKLDRVESLLTINKKQEEIRGGTSPIRTVIRIQTVSDLMHSGERMYLSGSFSSAWA